MKRFGTADLPLHYGHVPLWLAAKVDNTAIQDGFQLYQHNFIVDNKGQWAVIQQGMNPDSKTAGRYHWHSVGLQSFIIEPHTFVYGENQGAILNLTAQAAEKSQEGILELTKESPKKIIREMQYLSMPGHDEVRMEDVNMKTIQGTLRNFCIFKIGFPLICLK